MLLLVYSSEYTFSEFKKLLWLQMYFDIYSAQNKNQI